MRWLRRITRVSEAIDVVYRNHQLLFESHQRLYAAHFKLAYKVEALSGIEVAYPEETEVDKLREEVKRLRQMVAHLVPVEMR